MCADIHGCILGPKEPASLPWSRHASEPRLIVSQGPVHLYSLKAWCGQERGNTSPDWFSQLFLFINSREADPQLKGLQTLKYVKRIVIILALGFQGESTPLNKHQCPSPTLDQLSQNLLQEDTWTSVYF